MIPLPLDPQHHHQIPLLLSIPERSIRNYSIISTDQWAQFLNDCTVSVPKTITVKGPTLTTPLTSWPAKSHQYIFWDATGFATTDKVKITLVNDTPNTGAWETIIASAVDAIQDSYEWNQIDGIGATGTKFKIRIDSIGISPSVSGTGGYFTITYPSSYRRKTTV